MKVTFLGTSSAVHTPKRNHPAIAMQILGELMLFDCGEATQKQLMHAKISPMKITKIFLTHLHGDHILGLPGLLQSMEFRERENPITIYGPKGTKRIIENMKNFIYSNLNFIGEIVEIEDGTVVETDKYIIKAQKVKHNVLTYAYSIEEIKNPTFLREKAIELGVPVGPLFGKLHRGEEVEVNGKVIKPEQVLGKPKKARKIVYSGDTKPCEEMIDLAKNADLLIHESTYGLEDEELANRYAHSTSKEAAKIAKIANVKKLILTHFSPRYNEIDNLLKEAKDEFENTIAAEDLMKIEIK